MLRAPEGLGGSRAAIREACASIRAAEEMRFRSATRRRVGTRLWRGRTARPPRCQPALRALPVGARGAPARVGAVRMPGGEGRGEVRGPERPRLPAAAPPPSTGSRSPGSRHALMSPNDRLRHMLIGYARVSKTDVEKPGYGWPRPRWPTATRRCPNCAANSASGR